MYDTFDHHACIYSLSTTRILGPHTHKKQHFWCSFIQLMYTCTCTRTCFTYLFYIRHTVYADVDIRKVAVEYSSGSIHHSVCHTWVDTQAVVQRRTLRSEPLRAVVYVNCPMNYNAVAFIHGMTYDTWIHRFKDNVHSI